MWQNVHKRCSEIRTSYGNTFKKKKANLQLDVETEIVHVDHFVQLSTEERTERYSISDNDIFIGKRKNT